MRALSLVLKYAWQTCRQERSHIAVSPLARLLIEQGRQESRLLCVSDDNLLLPPRQCGLLPDGYPSSDANLSGAAFSAAITFGVGRKLRQDCTSSENFEFCCVQFLHTRPIACYVDWYASVLYAANRGCIEGDGLAYNTASRRESGGPSLARRIPEAALPGRSGEEVLEADLAHIPPLEFGHIISNGTYCSTAIFKLRTAASFQGNQSCRIEGVNVAYNTLE